MCIGDCTILLIHTVNRRGTSRSLGTKLLFRERNKVHRRRQILWNFSVGQKVIKSYLINVRSDKYTEMLNIYNVTCSIATVDLIRDVYVNCELKPDINWYAIKSIVFNFFFFFILSFSVSRNSYTIYYLQIVEYAASRWTAVKPTERFGQVRSRGRNVLKRYYYSLSCCIIFQMITRARGVELIVYWAYSIIVFFCCFFLSILSPRHVVEEATYETSDGLTGF